MKLFTITSICLLLSISAFTQVPSGNINKDTTLANELFEEAKMSFSKNEKTGIEQLKKAIVLYETHLFSPQTLLFRGRLTQELLAVNAMQEVETVALKTIELAEKELKYQYHQSGTDLFSVSIFL